MDIVDIVDIVDIDIAGTMKIFYGTKSFFASNGCEENGRPWVEAAGAFMSRSRKPQQKCRRGSSPISVQQLSSSALSQSE